MSDVIRPAHCLVTFSSGEYSDYQIHGVVITLEPCNFTKLSQQYKKEFFSEDEWDEPNQDGFLSWLLNKQHVALIDCMEVYLGSYSELDVSTF